VRLGVTRMSLRWNGPERTDTPTEVAGRMELLPTTIEGGCEGCGGWKWDNELVMGVVWKEASKSTTQSVGEGSEAMGCVERARGGAPTKA
jgi:hypothetical protein